MSNVILRLTVFLKIAYNGSVLGEGWALVVQNFKLETNDYRKHKL